MFDKFARLQENLMSKLVRVFEKSGYQVFCIENVSLTVSSVLSFCSRKIKGKTKEKISQTDRVGVS